MIEREVFRYFLDPKGIAVVGASRRVGFSWGRGIFQHLVRSNSERKIYPVNPNAEEIMGIKAYPDVSSIPDEVDLAIIAIPAQSVLQTVEECARKGIKAAMIISAGFGETPVGSELQEELAQVVKRSGIRLVGPNISGIYDASTGFNASLLSRKFLLDTPIVFICQGGFAVYNLIQHGHSKGMGVGKFMHTGNECDLTCTDFLEYCGNCSEVEVVLMYVEGLRDGRRFFKVAKEVSREKPIIVVKGGETETGAKAALSHTGAMAGSKFIFDSALKQANVVQAPRMELMLKLGYAFLEQPPLRGNKIAVVTVGGTWGVLITDALERNGLAVPKLSQKLQEEIRGLGLPYWASTKNPVDLGAAGWMIFDEKMLKALEILLSSEEIDGAILHGIGMATVRPSEDLSDDMIEAISVAEKECLEKALDLSSKYDKPLFVCTFLSEKESQTVQTLVEEEKRIYHDVEDVAVIAASLCQYYLRMRE